MNSHHDRQIYLLIKETNNLFRQYLLHFKRTDISNFLKEQNKTNLIRKHSIQVVPKSISNVLRQ